MMRPLLLIACTLFLSTGVWADDCPSGTVKVVKDGRATCVPAPGGRVLSPYLSL